MSQENEIEAEKLSPTTDFLPSDGASCSLCGGSGTVMIAEKDGDAFWNRCVPCQCKYDPLIPVRVSKWAWLNQCAKELEDVQKRNKNMIGNIMDDIEELRNELDEARAIANKACAMLAKNGFETNYPPMPWDDDEEIPTPPMGDRSPNDHGPDHIREVLES